MRGLGMPEALPTITNKQQAFVDAYLRCLNATEAAREASYAHPNKQGPRLLVNVGIARAIAAAMAERAMSANEVLDRLAAQARGSFEDFLDEENSLDLAKARQDGKLGLIKKLTVRQTRYGTETAIELHDQQGALHLLGKAHGLFTDRTEHTGDVTLRVVYGETGITHD